MIRYRMTCPSRSQNLPPGTQILLILWLQVMYHQGRIKGSLSTKVVSTYRMNRTSFRVCSDGLLRRCVLVEEGIKIIERCHSSPFGGHYGAFHTHSKIQQSRFFWPTIYEDTKDFIRRCGACQRHGNINSRDAMPLTNNLQIRLFDVQGIDYMDHFQSQRTVNTWQLTMSPSGLKPCHVELLMRRTPSRCLKRQYFQDSEF